MDAPLSVGGSVVRSIQNVHSNKGRDASIVWGAAPSPLLCSEKEGAARRVRRSLGRLSCKEVGAKANVASVTLPRNTHPNSAAVGVDLRLVQGRASEIVQQGFGDGEEVGGVLAYEGLEEVDGRLLAEALAVDDRRHLRAARRGDLPAAAVPRAFFMSGVMLAPIAAVWFAADSAPPAAIFAASSGV